MESPLSVQFSDNGVLSSTANFSAIGGEAVDFNIQGQNKSSKDIETINPFIEITAPSNWTGTEFTKVTYQDPNWSGDITNLLYYVDMTDGSKHPFSEISAANTKTARIIFMNNATGINTFPANSTTWNKIHIETNPMIEPGTYTMKIGYASSWTGALQ